VNWSHFLWWWRNMFGFHNKFMEFLERPSNIELCDYVASWDVQADMGNRHSCGKEFHGQWFLQQVSFPSGILYSPLSFHILFTGICKT